MTTPTREQVIEWAKEIGFMRYQVELTPLETTIESWAGSSDDLTQLATLAMSAGREQGLREAKEVCEALSTKVYDHAKPPYLSCAAAIEQLRA